MIFLNQNTLLLSSVSCVLQRDLLCYSMRTNVEAEADRTDRKTVRVYSIMGLIFLWFLYLTTCLCRYPHHISTASQEAQVENTKVKGQGQVPTGFCLPELCCWGFFLGVLNGFWVARDGAKTSNYEQTLFGMNKTLFCVFFLERE